MKVTKLSYSIICAASLFLVSCTVSDMQATIGNGSAVSTAAVNSHPTDANKIKLYYGNEALPKQYQAIGHVRASNYNFAGMPFSEESIAKELKKQAASIGGTGVINIKEGLDKTTGDVIILK